MDAVAGPPVRSGAEDAGVVATAHLLAQAVKGRAVEGSTAPPRLAEDVFVSQCRAAGEEAGAQPLNLFFESGRRRVGHG